MLVLSNWGTNWKELPLQETTTSKVQIGAIPTHCSAYGSPLTRNTPNSKPTKRETSHTASLAPAGARPGPDRWSAAQLSGSRKAGGRHQRQPYRPIRPPKSCNRKTCLESLEGARMRGRLDQKPFHTPNMLSSTPPCPGDELLTRNRGHPCARVQRSMGEFEKPEVPNSPCFSLHRGVLLERRAGDVQLLLFPTAARGNSFQCGH